MADMIRSCMFMVQFLKYRTKRPLRVWKESSQLSGSGGRFSETWQFANNMMLTINAATTLREAFIVYILHIVYTWSLLVGF